MSKKIDRTGQKFARLTFVERDAEDPRKWVFACDCGRKVSIYTTNVTRGLTKSCGCFRREDTAARFSKESKVKDDPEYVAEYNRQYRERNRDKLTEQKRAYNAANKGRLSEVKRACYLKRREHYMARIKANYAADPEATIRRERHKATLKKEATPAWADLEAIKEMYREARRLAQETGVKHHVDHIVPLRHALVCGLHVQDNLQVITAAENWRKHNSFSVDYAVDGLAWE